MAFLAVHEAVFDWVLALAGQKGMLDGTTHLAYKAEHAVDLETEMIVVAKIYLANQADTRTLEDTVNMAQVPLRQAGSAAAVQAVVADKGYHSAAVTETKKVDVNCGSPTPITATGSWCVGCYMEIGHVYTIRKKCGTCSCTLRLPGCPAYSCAEEKVHKTFYCEMVTKGIPGCDPNCPPPGG